MQEHRYPEYPQHRAEHLALTKKVAKFQKDYAAGQAVLTIEILQFLKDWLRHHIGEIDTKVGAYLKQQAN